MHCMNRCSRRLGLPLLTVVAVLLLGGSAAADVGIEAVSPAEGAPGDRVTVRVGCGFCYPPCEGPKGERHPPGREHGACIPGTRTEPPDHFPISLLPIGSVPRVLACQAPAACPAVKTSRLPERPPFTYIGAAVRRTKAPNSGGDIPHYLLRFRIPDLKEGVYAYVLYCGACWQGAGGSLISSPFLSGWRLRVEADGPGTAPTDLAQSIAALIRALQRLF
jgi:hypothetical protein